MGIVDPMIWTRNGCGNGPHGLLMGGPYVGEWQEPWFETDDVFVVVVACESGIGNGPAGEP